MWSTNQGAGAITTSLTLQYSSSSKMITMALDELLDLRNRLVSLANEYGGYVLTIRRC
jgi:hypothetical protein